MSSAVRFIVLSNNYLQIRGIKKTDEGTYRCEGRILARGEINFKDIQVIVNGEGLRAAPHPRLLLEVLPQSHTILFLCCVQRKCPRNAGSGCQEKNTLRHLKLRVRS